MSLISASASRASTNRMVSFGAQMRWRLRPVLLVLLGCAAPLAGAADAPYRWQNVAIGGGGFVTGLTYHPGERGLAYARTDVGGAYRWDDAGKRWVALTDWIGVEDVNLTGIESLAIDPSDTSRVYLAAGTYTNPKVGNGAILRSQDRGATFQRTDLPFKLGGNELSRGNGERLAVDPNDGRVLLFGTRRDGLWRSEDHGARWSKMKSFPAIASSSAAGVPGWNGEQRIGIVFVEFDPVSGQPGAPTPRIYAGVSTQETSLYVSEDAGRSWKAVEGQPVGLRPNHMARGSDGTYYLSYADLPGPDKMSDGAVWKFVPTTGAWTDITPAPQSTDTEGDGFGWGAVTVDPQNPQVLLASTFTRYGPHDDIFRSTDGGASWQPLFARSYFDHSISAWTADHTPHWMADIEIDPFNSDEAMFVTGYGIWASRNLTAFDDGTSRVQWWFKNTYLEETVPLDLISPPEGAHLLSAIGDIDGFRHDDLAVPPLQFAGPRLTNGESIAYAGQAPAIIVRSGTVRHRNNNEVRAAYSLDGGKNWKLFASEPPEGEGAGHITIAADGKRVIWQPKNAGAWITADFGGRWQKVKGVPGTAVIEADRVDEGIYYGFDGATGKLYVSGNGGVEFKEVQGAVGEFGDWFRPELHPDPQRSAVVYLTASWRGLLRWSAGNLERLPSVENAFSLGLGKPRQGSTTPTLYLFGQVAGKTGLFRSDDDGNSWQCIDDDAHRFGKIYSVTGDPRLYGRVYFATGGRGIVYGDPR
ncbi:hypothetical protein SAMN06296416_1087 [Pseudoxanthomonas wuyuanensis]|uniref:Cellulase n=2 Tax=Pseudoxanthomonas wuyuanensis TaxID=1073196 RepID=A0A286DAT8_9GAMM|nr:hypothetical protein SAMN06296416_1087 [Pseudoxanthomonas wuyuanensis]